MNPQSSFIQKLIVPFVIIMLAVTAYLVYKKNPEIMSQEPYFKMLLKNHDISHARVIHPNLTETFFSPLSKTATDRLSHRYIEMNAEDFIPTPYPSSEGHWLATDDFLIIKSHNQLRVTSSRGGPPLWVFDAPSTTAFSPGAPVRIGSVVYLSTLDGQIYALHIPTGQLVWYVTSDKKYFHAPLVHQNDLLLFVENKALQSWSLQILDAKTGLNKTAYENLELPFSGEPVARDGVLYFATATGHLYAVRLESGKPAWSSEGSSSFRSGPTLTSERIYLTNEDGLVLGFDRKSGRKLIEIELGSIVHEAIHPVEGTSLALTVDVTGHLIGIDLKASKRIWRYNLNAPQLHNSFMRLLRISSASLTQLNFDSTFRGWTAWVICNTSRICIFDAKGGRLLYRMDLEGEPLAQFEFVGKSSQLIVPLKREDRFEMIGFKNRPPKTSPSQASAPSPASPPRAHANSDDIKPVKETL